MCRSFGRLLGPTRRDNRRHGGKTTVRSPRTGSRRTCGAPTLGQVRPAATRGNPGPGTHGHESPTIGSRRSPRTSRISKPATATASRNDASLARPSCSSSIAAQRHVAPLDPGYHRQRRLHRPNAVHRLHPVHLRDHPHRAKLFGRSTLAFVMHSFRRLSRTRRHRRSHGRPSRPRRPRAHDLEPDRRKSHAAAPRHSLARVSPRRPRMPCSTRTSSSPACPSRRMSQNCSPPTSTPCAMRCDRGCCSLIAPQATPTRAVAIAGELAERGVGFIDAPVSGGVAGAEAGTLDGDGRR